MWWEKQPTERGAKLTRLPGTAKLAPTTMCVRTHTSPNRGERARSRQMGMETHQRSCNAAIARRQRQHINAVARKEKRKHLERSQRHGIVSAATRQCSSVKAATWVRGYSTTHHEAAQQRERSSAAGRQRERSSAAGQLRERSSAAGQQRERSSAAAKQRAKKAAR